MKKKSFRNDLEGIQNPAMSFISKDSIERAEGKTYPEQSTKQTGAASGYMKEERKTKRVQLLITPSLYAAIKEKAEAAGTSTNNYINYILKAEVEE